MRHYEGIIAHKLFTLVTVICVKRTLKLIASFTLVSNWFTFRKHHSSPTRASYLWVTVICVKRGHHSTQLFTPVGRYLWFTSTEPHSMPTMSAPNASHTRRWYNTSQCTLISSGGVSSPVKHHWLRVTLGCSPGWLSHFKFQRLYTSCFRRRQTERKN